MVPDVTVENQLHPFQGLPCDDCLFCDPDKLADETLANWASLTPAERSREPLLLGNNGALNLPGETDRRTFSCGPKLLRSHRPELVARTRIEANLAP